MKKLAFFVAVVLLVSCGGKTASQQTENDSISAEPQEEAISGQAETQDEPEEGIGDISDIDDSPGYTIVSNASEADIITFTADGTFIAKNVSGGPNDKYVYKVFVSILKEDQVCKMDAMVNKYTGENEIGSSTSLFRGRWAIKSEIQSGGTKDFYVLNGKNEQGDQFNMKVRVRFNECYSLEPLPHIDFKISELEMGKY